MKKIIAVVICLILACSCLIGLSACGKQDLSQSQYLGTWKATDASFRDEKQDIDEVLKDGDFIITLNGDGTATVDDGTGASSANWKETSKGVKVKGDDINTKMTWLGDSFDLSIFGVHLILTKQSDESTGAATETAAEFDARPLIINSEPVVVTAKESFDNFGVTEFVCDASETYSFTKSDDDTTWKVFVLDEKFADGARYLPQAEEPALEGDGTLKIEEGKYIYILCSESSFTGDAATDAALTINYAEGDEDDPVTPDNLFTRGVWSASIDGKIDTYFIFDDESNGRTERADGTGGVPFTCEQKAYDVTFHFGSPDDVTEAKFSTGDNTGTFNYGDKEVTYYFEAVSNADPATFEVPAAE